MKNVILLSFLICFFTAADAQATAKARGTKNSTEVKSEPATPAALEPVKADETLKLKEESFDFGKIPQGKPVTHIFEVINSGTADIKIDNVQASCGCTTPEWDKDATLAPGGSTRITVGYNAAAEGPFNKTVTVTYNGTQTRQITIKGEVWKTPSTSAPGNAGIEDLKN